MISEMKDLTQLLGEQLLKIMTIFYYKQLSAGGVITIMANLLRNQDQSKWGDQISKEILQKWPTLQLPSYQILPPQSKKIKLRSIGLKKKEMILFTELNRYKNILMILLQITNK